MDNVMSGLARYSGPLDKIAASTSAICAAHCLSLPLLLGVFPALGATFFGDESFHVWLLWLVIPLSLVALTLGCRTHKDVTVALMGLLGLALLISAAILGHDYLGEAGERALSLAGAVAIAAGHLRNYTLCRRAGCDHS